MGVAYNQVLPILCTVHTVVGARARSCQQSNAYFEGKYLFGERPLRIQEHSPGMLSIDALARENYSLCQKFLLK